MERKKEAKPVEEASQPPCSATPILRAVWRHDVDRGIYGADGGHLELTVYQDHAATLTVSGGRSYASVSAMTVEDLLCLARQFNAAASQLEHWQAM